MDNFAIISIAIFLGIALLTWLAVILNKQYKRKLKKEKISFLAQKNQAKIDDFSFNSDFIIGIDKSKKQLFFIKKEGDSEIYDIIDLEHYNLCQQKVDVRTGANNFLIYDNISLTLKSNNKDFPNKTIELYNSQTESIEVINEPKIAEQWEALINSIIQHK